jgi:hypothetical protein
LAGPLCVGVGFGKLAWWICWCGVVMRWCCNGEVRRCWHVGSDIVSVRLMSCVFCFSWYLICWPFYKSVEICRILFESLRVSKSVEICSFLVSSWTLVHQC